MNGASGKDKRPTIIKQKKKPSNKTYKDAAQYKSNSPTHSQTSENQLITQYGDLTHSQQNPTPQEEEIITNENDQTVQQYYDECPREFHPNLEVLITMGLTHDVINQAIEGWIPKSSAGFPKGQP